MHHSISDIKGFKCWGAHVGIKSKRRDLAIIFSSTPASAAAIFTRNLVVAEPVKLSRKHVKDGIIQAIVVNSGNANACTGEKGRQAAEKTAEVAAEELGIKKENVLVASTGIIGEPFPIDKVVDGIKYKVVPKLSNRKIAGTLTSNAILTTDTFAKEGYSNFKIGKKKIMLAGIAKGSGMIHPNMGTMLGFIISDLAISSELLREALLEVNEKTFNMISVDGDTSTNDMLAVLCNGAAGNRKITEKNDNYYKFVEKLEELARYLAKLIVSDGEGSTKFIEYEVTGAPDDEGARKIARTISDSNLVKTAVFGRDPNWGRIVAAAGRAGVDFDPDKIDLIIGFKDPVQILEKSQPTDHNRTMVKRKMRASQIKIAINLNSGEGKATAWGSDFSYEYVRINAEYTT
jgi:glutamate N-acetyltransferase/amino-acid N-acetyltransferase